VIVLNKLSIKRMNGMENLIPLEDYPNISEKCSDFPDDHPLKIASTIENKRLLDFFESLLTKLREVKGLPSKINEIKRDKGNFNSYVSELKVAAFLKDRVDDLEIIPSSKEGKNPDISAENSGKTVTIEVKRIEDKRETRKGKVKYNHASAGMPYEFEDEHTRLVAE
jgi:hypothetical protein